MAWTWLRRAVRWRTSEARWATRRRSARVSVSGTQTSATKSAAPSFARTFASTLSVPTFAWVIALVCIGLDIVILPACSASRSTIAHETDVDSSTTWSVGSSAAAKARRSLVSNRPTRRT